jgi:hypothetical protein
VAAEGGRVGPASTQFGVYRLQHAIEILIDIIVPETKDVKAIVGETCITNAVSRLMFIEIVLPAVEFDYQFMLHTNKVHDEPVTGRLAPEVVSALSPSTKVNPEFYFLAGHGLPQSSCNWVCHCPHPARYARHPPPSGEG